MPVEGFGPLSRGVDHHCEAGDFGPCRSQLGVPQQSSAQPVSLKRLVHGQTPQPG
jgi:hypothetical protein